MKRYHYVYRITNIKGPKKYYYGTRTTSKKVEILPQDELGKSYFSSSKDKTFILDQKVNSKNYKYKVIKIFKTRQEALGYEIFLHNKFNVEEHELFYNNCNQTSSTFDITNKVSCLDLSGNRVLVSSEEYKKGHYTRDATNMVSAINKKTRQNMFVPKELFVNDPDLVGHDFGKVSAIDLRTNTLCKVTQLDFTKHKHYVGVNYGKMSGKNNTNAKRIQFYRPNGKLFYEFNGDFVPKCKEFGIPAYLIINSNKNKAFIKTSGKFKGWNGYYAIYV